MIVLSELGRIPIKVWVEKASDIEESCIKQAAHLANLPFAHHHASLMPDTHVGYGMPIGGVLATEGVIIPYAVGVDIGCGMGFIETNIPYSEIEGVQTPNGELRKAIIADIMRNVPVGFRHHNEKQKWELLDDPPDYTESIDIICQEINSAKYQLGTLGGGNHFIELQVNEKDNLCLMIHSGSRNFGLKIANVYNKIAVELNEKWHSSIDPKWQLAFLPYDSDEGNEYNLAMTFALKFAEENRNRIMNSVKESTFHLVEKHTGFKNIKSEMEVNIHHNYAALEHHYGKNVWVHRKGAIRMREGELGIIPGSMGTSSYIVSGKGNPDSFESASHGAGRVMGRAEAKRKLSVEEQRKRMFGIATFVNIENVLDECPGAYKDIDKVIENERDLIDVIMKLRPVGSIKAEGKDRKRKNKK